MTWLLKLYPPRWRRRYGEEFIDLMAAQPFSVGAAIDVISGAIDAWIHPQLSAAVRAAPEAKGETTMMAKVMRFKCAGYGSEVTTADAMKGAAVALGGSAVLALVWIWAGQRFADHVVVESLMPMAFFIPLLVGLRYTSLKGRSAGVQAIFIIGLCSVLSAMFLIAGWLGARL